ncbi:hypothetical protein L2E82_14524 [Cichorium intybus]|uniref:Uncharacterized protein n=1 Tax=Cichorium intybus TaxID=13427 RepID=A0ACB9EZP4_CICIN|nr:hypothetical protein L2E82_14524 [Cichorium intybus]
MARRPQTPIGCSSIYDCWEFTNPNRHPLDCTSITSPPMDLPSVINQCNSNQKSHDTDPIAIRRLEASSELNERRALVENDEVGPPMHHTHNRLQSGSSIEKLMMCLLRLCVLQEYANSVTWSSGSRFSTLRLFPAICFTDADFILPSLSSCQAL